MPEIKEPSELAEPPLTTGGPVQQVHDVGTSAPAPEPPLSRSDAQNAAILSAIQAKNIDPKSFPIAPSGKKGLKSEIRAALTHSRKDIFQSIGVFDDAWQRLRDTAEIKDSA